RLVPSPLLSALFPYTTLFRSFHYSAANANGRDDSAASTCSIAACVAFRIQFCKSRSFSRRPSTGQRGRVRLLGGKSIRFGSWASNSSIAHVRYLSVPGTEPLHIRAGFLAVSNHFPPDCACVP